MTITLSLRYLVGTQLINVPDVHATAGAGKFARWSWLMWAEPNRKNLLNFFAIIYTFVDYNYLVNYCVKQFATCRYLYLHVGIDDYVSWYRGYRTTLLTSNAVYNDERLNENGASCRMLAGTHELVLLTV